MLNGIAYSGSGFVPRVAYGGGAGVPAPMSPQRPTYSNANMPKDVADPAVMRGPDGVYYAYATQQGDEKTGRMATHLPVYASRDLVHWQFAGDAMPALPAWVQGDTWAPQTVRTGNHYTMFYSARDHNGMMNIGYAVAPSPLGPFQDKGIAVAAPQHGADNNPGVTIDPAFFQDSDGKMYLYWGSANGDKRWFAEGITAQQIRIQPDGTIENVGGQQVVKPKAGDDKGIVEGAWVERHGGSYYMFYSDGAFNNGYELKVARSSSPLGPFTGDRTLLTGTATFSNPGHTATTTDDAGQEWAVYAAYRGSDTTADRQMMLDKITWGADGWPTIGNGHPSDGPQVAPVIVRR